MISADPAIEVFRTNVEGTAAAATLRLLLLALMPGSRIDFDLEDCDRILRISYHNTDISSVVRLLADHGFECQPLDY